MQTPKIIGLVTGWGSEIWMKPAIEQALYLCDEVIVGVGAWSEYMDEFEDGTLDVCAEYKDYENVTVVPYTIRESKVNFAVAASLNAMLTYSKLYEPGNWIWLLDCDEFYHKRTKTLINEMIATGMFNRIDFQTRFFLIDLYHYVKGKYVRMWKIEDINMDLYKRFNPTHHWTQNPYVGEVPLKDGMFHYSMLKNPHAMVRKWEHEYQGNKQDHKINYANKIYKNYDLADEEYWTTMNLDVSGIKHPWFTDSMEAKKDGHLFEYKDKLPEYVAESKLIEVKDFRKLYNF